MSLRRLAAVDSPFRRLGAHTASCLKSAGHPTGASRQPLRRIGGFDSTLPRIGGCDATLRRLGAVATRPSTPRRVDLVVGIPRTTRWMSTLPGGGPASSAPAGGAQKTGPAVSAPAGGAQKTGPASSAGGADEHGSGAEGKGPKTKEKFDWDNFDWNLFMKYFKVADVVRKVFKLLGCVCVVLGFSACGGAAVYAVRYLLNSEIKAQVGEERDNRVDFEKKATVARGEFVLRTNTRYDHLQAQFFELWEKYLALERLCNQLQKQLDGQAEGEET